MVPNVGDPRSLEYELSKYARPQPLDPPLEFVNAAVVEITQRLMTGFLQSGVSTLPAIDINEALGAIDLTTSPGFPWNLKYGSKEALVKSDDLDLFLDRFMEVWDMSPSWHKEDINVLWYAFLKEELRTVEKATADPPVVRSISASPFELTVALAMECTTFNEAFYGLCENPIFPSIVGLSYFNGGWNRIWLQCTAFGRMLVAIIDAMRWDRSFPNVGKDVVVTVRKNMIWEMDRDNYEERIARIIGFYLSIMCAHVVVPVGFERFLVRIVIGMLSGWGNTTVDNTIFHVVVLFTLLLSLNLMGTYGTGVIAVLYGDDNALFVTPEIARVLTPEVIRAWYARWGIECHPFRYVSVTATDDYDLLGGRFYYDEVSGYRVYQPADPQKGIDAMRFKSTGDDSKAYVRACAIRTLHFYNADVCKVATDYARSLEDRVPATLRSNYLTDATIRALNTGHECGNGVEVDAPLKTATAIPDELRFELELLWKESL